MDCSSRTNACSLPKTITIVSTQEVRGSTPKKQDSVIIEGQAFNVLETGDSRQRIRHPAEKTRR